ncbi:hypothetical protein HPB48_001484 [Haemaphysalis longicornis]|uniref:Snake toxin/toxin-like domain-containing protein n=1 Tax=Haemaphysalis longicornis TaxID=44386 RepID=A0A9J6FFX6_HAELO|nr:hypothetical protein HPB48_001484 [Haemaphysalis longicornis]
MIVQVPLQESEPPACAIVGSPGSLPRQWKSTAEAQTCKARGSWLDIGGTVNRQCEDTKAVQPTGQQRASSSGVRGSPGRGGASSATGGGGGSPSSAVVATEERQNLTCYACNSQLDSEGCRFPHNMSLAMRRTCPPSHRYCTVTRVDYSVDPGGATRAFSIERNCSEHCTTECVAVGERLRLYMCHSCCSDSLCNTGNEARALLEERLLASRRLAVPLIALLVAACF